VNKYAKNILRAYDNMLEDLERLDNEGSTVRIDCTPAIATYALPCAIYKIREKYPNMNIHLNTNHSENIEDGILNDNYDIGFVLKRPDDRDLIAHKVFEDDIVAVAPANLPLERCIEKEVLQKQNIILLNGSTRLRELVDEKLTELGINKERLKVIFELDSIESVKSTVLSGFGVSFLPYVSVKKELYTRQLQRFEVKGYQPRYEVYLVYKKENFSNNKEIKNFTDIFKQIGTKAFC